MVEVGNEGVEITIAEAGKELPTGDKKFVHIPENAGGKGKPEVVIFGPGEPIKHAELAATYLGIAPDEAKKINYINAGSIRFGKDKNWLMQTSMGLNALTPSGGGTDMMRVTEEEKYEMDRKTMARLNDTYKAQGYIFDTTAKAPART